MRFAYADPPYLGLAEKFYGHLHPQAAEYDRVETHAALIARLSDEFPDGWAMSLHSPALRTILPLCPGDCRVMPWVTPFASFKPGVGVAYAWEPVIVRGGRRRTRDQKTVRDWVDVNITLRKGLTGAKPREFCYWICDVLNVQPGEHDMTIDKLCGHIVEDILGAEPGSEAIPAKAVSAVRSKIGPVLAEKDAEIERLEDRLHEVLDSRARLIEENDSLSKDAKRYRHLRDDVFCRFHDRFSAIIYHVDGCETVDETIDAACGL